VDECKPLVPGAVPWVLHGPRPGLVQHGHGKAVQVDPIKPALKESGSKRLKLNYDYLLLSFALNFILRRYMMVVMMGTAIINSVAFPVVGRCRLTL